MKIRILIPIVQMISLETCFWPLILLLFMEVNLVMTPIQYYLIMKIIHTLLMEFGQVEEGRLDEGKNSGNF